MAHALGTQIRFLRCTGIIAIATATVVAVGACRREPTVSDENYQQAVVAFHTGLAALETSQEVLARRHLERVTTLAPHEPAAWADIGLLLLRQQELDAAAERLTKAAALAPDEGAIQRLLGLTESRRGNLAAATRHWKRALALRPDDAKAAYALALDLERQGTPETLQEAQRTLDSLAARTGNVVARLEYARVAAKRADAPAVQRGVAALAAAAASWPADIKERLRSVQEAAASNPRGTGPAIAFLKNVLMRLPEYRRWLAALSTPREEVGQPIDRFLVLPNPTPQPAPADESLVFTVQAESRAAAAGWAGAVWLGADGLPIVATWDGTSVQLAGRAVWTSPRAAGPPPANAAGSTREAILAADLNYDFKTDLVVSGGGGLAVLRQQGDGTFTDVTAAAGLPDQVRSAAAAGAWAADVDTDGDLDVVTPAIEGPVRVLRNNGDGTFAVQEPFAGATRIRGFVWADGDGDGVPDAALLDAAGVTRTYINARGGTFRERAVPTAFPKAVALAAAEVTGDSVMDVLALAATGTIVSLSQSPDGSGWAVREVARIAPFESAIAPGAAGLIVADLDNNGAADFVGAARSATHVVLRGPSNASRPLAEPIRLDARAAADMDGDGRVDLVGLTAEGKAATARSRGRMQYAWQTLRPHAATATGDQRINSFGLGGEVELRTGLHVQKRLIAAPLVHIGIGTAKRSEVVRIVWPNGTLQSEFDVAANAAIPATQRLKGSCPWLFAWNGREMAFVTDVLWRSPLGLRINAQQNADVLMTEDWVRVRGDQLRPIDGAYDLRITAELWETHFFDLASLLIVDHPAGTEVFVDERFAVPPPALRVTVTGPVEPMSAARDDRGADVAAVVRERDDRHLDTAGRGAYQGVTREHFVELTVPDSAPRAGPLWLVAQGWIHPTDSSINVAIGQGGHERPRGLRLAVADHAGRFRTIRENLGFPAGKDKTVLIDLAGVFAGDGLRRLRLYTNMEIFWDRLGWAVGRPDVQVAPNRIPLGSAELRYRGYSPSAQTAPGSPERPRYAIEGTTPRWLDLEGYYTRFGDVRELLLAVDDRYVIMNAGDELRLRFPEAPPPPVGTIRDFVMITDGWEKDGDFNTTFSRTVLPLPTHRSARYDQAPGRLEDDPIYRQHPDDFAEYHTRYVTPDGARHALTRQRDPGP
jgi:tetratricopeptide (TPR) repeat protein